MGRALFKVTGGVMEVMWKKGVDASGHTGVLNMGVCWILAMGNIMSKNGW